MTRTLNHSHRFFAHPALRVLAITTFAIALLALGASSAQAQRRSNAGRTTAASETSGSSYQGGTSRMSFGAELALPYLFSTLGSTSFNGIGFHIGGLVDLPVAPKTGILLKAGYESKHGSVSVSDATGSGSVSITLNYFEFAGLVRHDLSEKISLHGGLAVQLGSSGKVEASGEVGGVHKSGELNGSLSMPTQVALVAGAGYRVPLSSTMDLVPNASFNFFVTSPTPDGNSSAHTFTIGARLMFN